VLVILAHHRIVTKDIVEGLVQTFRQKDQEDWNGALWVLQELYDVDDVILELRQMFAWESFQEVYPHILPILANNASRLAIQVLHELLSHAYEPIRLDALEALLRIGHPLVEQYVSEASTDTTYADVRLAIAQYFDQIESEQTTYRLANMLHDADREVRLFVIRALQEREVPPESLRKALFTEQEPDLRTEVIIMLARLQDPAEGPYFAHLLQDLIAKRYADGSRSTGPSNVYTRLKKLIKHEEKQEEITMFSTLIQTVGFLQSEEAISGLISVVNNDTSPLLRKEAVHALGQIGSPVCAAHLQELIHTHSEPQDLRTEAEQALARIISRNS
jgi:HEAT repeat protein